MLTEPKITRHLVNVTKKFTICAGHFLPNTPPGHKCKRQHGHNWDIYIKLQGPVLEKEGWVIDFGIITRWFKEDPIYTNGPSIFTLLDHNNLNDVEINKKKPLKNPTSENLSIYIYELMWKKLREYQQDMMSKSLRDTLDGDPELRLISVAIAEKDDCMVEYFGNTEIISDR